MSAAERIRSLRLHYAFTQKDVVDRSGGLSKSEVSKLEAGALKGSSSRHRQLLGKAFGIAPRDIGLYLEGERSLDEILPVAARKTPLEEVIALGMKDQPLPWAAPSLAAARALELAGVQLSRTRWVARLDEIEAAMRAALPTIWERLLRGDPLDSASPVDSAGLSQDAGGESRGRPVGRADAGRRRSTGKRQGRDD